MLLKEIIRKGIQLRLFLIVLQYVANYIIQDHDAKVFTYLSTESHRTIWDDFIFSLLGGLINWDGQYFMHIALHGYTYENTLAFFPLLPLTVRYIASITQVPFINFETKVLLVFVLFNFVIFILTIIIFYVLTENWFGKHKAQVATLLFCINPASIFFSAAYTECLFAFLTFITIYCCWKLHFNSFLVSSSWLLCSCLSIILSTLTRSNGLLNLGFLGFFFVRNLRICLHFSKSNLALKLLKLGCNLIVLAISLIICVFPFVMLQFYNYSNYCFVNDLEMPDEIVAHAFANGYKLMGNFYNQSWCTYTYIPLPYSYVQSHYWNVGFLNYYELKQLPNFLLALPVIYITLSECMRFIRENPDYLFHWGIFKVSYSNLNKYYSNAMNKRENKMVDKRENKMVDICQNICENDLIFVCVVHALFLCTFCMFYVHIQVTTRMLFSANPIIYWFCLNKNKTLIKAYCFSYYIIGTIMFCNFLPWT